MKKKPIVFNVNGNGCFIVTNHAHRNGYFEKKIGGKEIYLHRLIYEECFGDIPKGMCVCHSCDDKECINPEHLFLGTAMDNVRDAIRKKRNVPPPVMMGESNPCSKLTEEKIIKIRSDIRSQRAIARDYGISQCQVNYIKLRKAWRQVA